MIDKRFLEGLGITDSEIIKSIIAEYGNDIKTEKDAVAAVQAQLQEANATIESYKGMDIESIRKSADDWEAKYKQSEADRAAFEHKTKVSSLVKGLNLKDSIYEEYLVNDLIAKELKFDGDKLIGSDDVIAAFKNDHPDAFATDKPLIDMGGGTKGVPLGDNGFNFNFEGVRPRNNGGK
ncbi:MAG: phage scaffolding protein [Ruminococcus sp.]|nr:phage scaffolding protein [Ruminococcus sp.]